MEQKNLRSDLIHLLTSLFATKQNTSDQYDIYAALQQGKIPLPEHIHTFLFSQETQESGDSIVEILRSMRKSLRKRIQQWTGWEKAEHYRRITEVLNFMETSLEIKYDYEHFNPNKH